MCSLFGISVAAKKIKPSFLSDEYLVDSFRREVAILRQMKHRNVLRLVGIGMNGNNDARSLLIVTELVAALFPTF